MKLEGKTFIVTGGGSGLGKGTCEVFVAAGANVVVADLNLEHAQAVASALGDKAAPIACDVTKEEQVQAAIDLALSQFGGLNGAVNCAGVGVAMRVTSKQGAFPLELWNLCINVNLTGTFNVIKLATLAMQKLTPETNGERGVFINTASVAAYDGQIGQAAYSASKAGVVGMTLPIARELALWGIRVMTIAPGLFDTPMLHALPEDAKQSLTAQVPFPSRFGKPSEFGEMARFIVENEMLNGETIRLDGAIRMQAK